MKNIYLTLIGALLCFSNLQAQSYQFNLGTVDTLLCSVDTSSTVYSFSNLRMYSTIDNEPLSLLDSSLCYSLTPVGNYWRFPSSSIPVGRSAFFEIELQDTIELDTSSVYILRSLFGLGCYLDACESAHLEMQMPDENGIDTASFVIEYQFIDEYESVACFATQKVEGQRIARIIFELQSTGIISDLWMVAPSIEPHWEGVNILPQLTVPQTNWGPNLVRYWHDVYPTSDSISYTDVLPYGNPTDSTLIQFNVDYFSSLYLQHHTAMRGSLVEGSDSIRHGLEVVLNGNMCLNYIEVMWEEGNQLVIDGGAVSMQGAPSCNLFGKGGGLKVRSGSIFRHGFNGVGMLALKTGMQLQIEPNAELIIDGPVFIYEYHEDLEPQQLYMELAIGAKLTFATGSTLSNQYSRDGSMKLNIYMRGGEVDLSGLTQEEQKLINLIYDEPSPIVSENLTVYPNPTTDVLAFIWVAGDANEHLLYEVFDLAGRKVVEASVSTSHAGHNKFEMNVTALKAGIYSLRLLSNNQTLALRKFVKE